MNIFTNHTLYDYLAQKEWQLIRPNFYLINFDITFHYILLNLHYLSKGLENYMKLGICPT